MDVASGSGCDVGLFLGMSGTHLSWIDDLE